MEKLAKRSLSLPISIFVSTKKFIIVIIIIICKLLRVCYYIFWILKGLMVLELDLLEHLSFLEMRRLFRSRRNMSFQMGINKIDIRNFCNAGMNGWGSWQRGHYHCQYQYLSALKNLLLFVIIVISKLLRICYYIFWILQGLMVLDLDLVCIIIDLDSKHSIKLKLQMENMLLSLCLQRNLMMIELWSDAMPITFVHIIIKLPSSLLFSWMKDFRHMVLAYPCYGSNTIYRFGSFLFYFIFYTHFLMCFLLPM